MTKFSALLSFFFLLFVAQVGMAQTATVRGFVYDNQNGEPVVYTNVFLLGTQYGTITDGTGFYNITEVKPGDYTLMVTGIGYDSARVDIQLSAGEILNQQVVIGRSGINLPQVDVEASRTEKEREVLVSEIKATPKDIKRIPTIGGEADLAQYLQIIPGVITTGDQGGQLYIRGGAPIHNKVLLDGLTVYNAFHSIGLFSVYETETIRNVNVLTGGFNAEYGGRISAVVDVRTRDGNKKRFGGLVGANPFVTKLILEGPLKKLDKEGASISYMVTSKASYLRETSKALYSYADSEILETDEILPYNFFDLFGKLSINSAGGSKFSFEAYNYTDRVHFDPVATYKWGALGIGTDFKIVPGQSKALINGHLNYSDYDIELTEADGRPRNSSIAGFELGVNFQYFLPKDGEIKYGVDISGFSTKFEFFNRLGLRLDQNQNTTELGGFLLYKKVGDKLVFEPSIRVHYYASLGDISPEPRLGLKYKLSDRVRLKFAGGVYSQNLISTKSDRDVVNLFTGFLSGPEERLDDINSQPSGHKLQKAVHAITGVEWDITDNLELNVEPYYKFFGQLINLNRNKVFRTDPNYMIEEGNAYGIDFLIKYDTEDWYLWTTYSLGQVNRNDGEQMYPPHYDRRHNMNIVAAYIFGKDNSWEAAGRFNYGSGFPFTRTQGFFEEIDFTQGVGTNHLTQNGNLGIIYDEDLNAGRLPDYHRLDLSLKKRWELSRFSDLEAIISVSNVYNRDNIFYFDRVRFTRVNQLPILPSIGINLAF